MPIEYFHPTPIFYNDLSVSEFEKIRYEIKDKLKPDLYTETTWSDLVSTTMNVTTNIVEHLNLDNLKNMLVKNAQVFLQSLMIDCQPSKFYLYESWFNVTYKHGFQNTHTHEGPGLHKNTFSGVYYYEHYDADPESSFLEFILDNKMTTTEVKYAYVPGRIIMFHGMIPHRVTYNKSDKPRTSLSFNFRFE